MIRHNPFFSSGLALVALIFSVEARGVEPWKVEPYKETFTISATGGLGILNGKAGGALNANMAGKLLHEGFLEDVTDQLYLEGTAGTVFLQGSGAFVYSLHLRWDFHYSEDWSFFAIGGFGGNVASKLLGSQVQFFPRYGVGALWHLFAKFSFRGELSHEFSGVGIQVAI